jgi:hypothetical protein
LVTHVAETAKPVQLKQTTLEAFLGYIQEAEAAMQPSLEGRAPFLWADEDPKRRKQIHHGTILAQFWSGQRPVKVPDGLIHDWIGAIYVPGETVDQALSLVQDYDNHKIIYQPEVMDSKLLSHHGDNFKIYLRLLKKKVLTVVLDTDHDVNYSRIDTKSWFCRSCTTRIAEVDDAGTPREKVHPPDSGYGFLWRLFSYWRFAEDRNGVAIECRAISLTRDVPFGLGFVIEPIIKNLPRESLINTLKATRDGLLAGE